jgi:hypothetical protein
MVEYTRYSLQIEDIWYYRRKIEMDIIELALPRAANKDKKIFSFEKYHCMKIVLW